MALYYQPVALPSIGGRSGQVSRSALTIGAGLNNLGDKITGLGDRRQRRLDEEHERKNARGLEILKLAAANTTDEAELNQIANSLGLLPGGDANSAVVVPGSADVINNARSRILGDNNDRAVAGRNQALFDIASNDLDAQELGTRFQAEYGQDLARMTNLRLQGKNEEAQAIADRISEVASPVFGANLVNERLRAGFEDRDTGESSRFGEKQNVQTLERLEDQDRDRDFTFNRRVIQAGRDDKNYDSNERIRAAVARAQVNGTSVGNQLDVLADDPNLTDEEQVLAQQALTQGPSLDVTNRIRDDVSATAPQNAVDPLTNLSRSLSNAFLGTELPTNQTSRVPVQAVIDGINSRTNDVIRSEPQLQIFETAQELAASGEFDGFADDIGIAVANRYPDYDISKDEQQLIKSVANQYNLTPEQTVALVGASIDNTTLIGQSPELHNSRFQENAKAFAADKGQIEERYNRIQRDRTQAATWQSQINSKTQELARLNQASNPDTDRIQKLNDEISTLTNRLLRVEGELNTRSGNGR